ncbi:peptidoglycan-binding protein [Streptomyces sp. NPDC058794]|uniref:peptidoglycan-binding domain-containing protein n=1 Tax=Streptomyces sp. NPDC058794 TaxID=3346636 RepID=UPI0036A4B625
MCAPNRAAVRSSCLIKGVNPQEPAVRWWSKERRPTSRGEMQVQGLPSARREPRHRLGGTGVLPCPPRVADTYRGIDGHFGKDARSAVMRFRRNDGSADDGIVGPHTWGQQRTP